MLLFSTLPISLVSPLLQFLICERLLYASSVGRSSHHLKLALPHNFWSDPLISINLFAPSLPSHLPFQVTRWNALSVVILPSGLATPSFHDVFKLPACRLTTLPFCLSCRNAIDGHAAVILCECSKTFSSKQPNLLRPGASRHSRESFEPRLELFPLRVRSCEVEFVILRTTSSNANR